MYCNKCGSKLEDGVKFCVNCGNPIDSDNSIPDMTGAINDTQAAPYQNNTYAYQQPEIPGKSNATVSLVLGIISIVFWFFGLFTIIGIILAVVGLMFASKSKKAGFNGGLRTGGFVCCLIGLIGGIITFVACVAVVAFTAAGYASDFYRYGRMLSEILNYFS